MRRERELKLILCVCASVFWQSSSRAETSALLEASATVVSGCEINGMLSSGGETLGQYGSLDFGSHSALSNATISASVSPAAGLVLSCTPGTTLTLALGSGQYASTTRNMKASGGEATIPYGLYRDAGLFQEYGIDQAYSINFSDPQAIALPIYGKVTLGGNMPPDTYIDTINLTLSW